MARNSPISSSRLSQQGYDDLMSGVDAVPARHVDTQRLFVTGGSGGGVLTAWIVGHTDRFRAAVVVKTRDQLDQFRADQAI